MYVLLHTYVAMFCCCGGGGRWCGRSCNDRKRRKRSLVNQLLQDADANRGADRPATWCRVRATRGLQKLHNRHLEDLLASAGGRGDRDNSSFWPSECMFGESTTADDRHWTLNEKLESVNIHIRMQKSVLHSVFMLTNILERTKMSTSLIWRKINEPPQSHSSKT